MFRQEQNFVVSGRITYSLMKLYHVVSFSSENIALYRDHQVVV